MVSWRLKMTTSGMLDGGGVNSLLALENAGDAVRNGVPGALLVLRFGKAGTALLVDGFAFFVLVKALVIFSLGFAEGNGFLPAFFFGFVSFPAPAFFAGANESGICFLDFGKG